MTNLEINQHGDLNNKQMVEPFLILSDGSKWRLMLFHYIDKGNNMFGNASEGEYCNRIDVGLYSRLKYIDNFQYNSKYEFYVIQDGIIHRWSQTNAPYSTTSVSGYTNIAGTDNGGICKCNGNTVLAATGTTSNWWRACGAYKSFSNSGKTGLPGFGPSGNNAARVAENYLALWVRVSDFNAFFEDGRISGLNLYEY